jgi:hypothetical protein
LVVCSRSIGLTSFLYLYNTIYPFSYPLLSCRLTPSFHHAFSFTTQQFHHSTMSSANRLLDMLKAASFPSPSSPSSLQPPQGSSSREPSPAPAPPPSLQAVTLQDLFANMTIPPKPPTPSAVNQDHQAKMLGMLGNLGRSTPSPEQVVVNEVKEDVLPPSITGEVAHKDNLLSMFKNM